MNKYIFILGTSKDLCLAELTHVLLTIDNSITIQPISSHLVSIKTAKELDTDDLIYRLGGTIKIASYLGPLSSPKAQAITQYLRPFSPEVFGLSNYSVTSLDLARLSMEVKGILQVKNKIRYVLAKDQVLGSAVFKQHGLQEYLLYDYENNWHIAHVVVVQDIDDWTKRDTGRPFFDPKLGMLPLKVARMMVNLASSKFKVHSSKTLLDPFCGMGTILGEALTLGWDVIGSDISQEVITKAQKNINASQPPLKIRRGEGELFRKPRGVKFFVCDAVHISQHISPNSIDAIVTEPFMGAPFEIRHGKLWQKGKVATLEQVQNTIKGLEKLLTGAIKDWSHVLKPNGKIVITLPSIDFHGQTYFVKKVVDNCEKLGYTSTQGPYTYSRPQAVVKRNIYVFEKS